MDYGAIFSVFKYLGPVDLARCRCSSHAFREIASTSELWRPHLMREFGLLSDPRPDAMAMFYSIQVRSCKGGKEANLMMMW